MLTSPAGLILGAGQLQWQQQHGGHKGAKQLIDAAEAGDAARVLALLDGPQPPPIDAKDTFGCTALMTAAMSGRREVVALLLGRGARIDTRDRNG
jgi:ankyrin repeat protein